MKFKTNYFIKWALGLVILFCIESCLFAQNDIAISSNDITILSFNTKDGHLKDSIAQKEFLGWIKNINPGIIGYQEMNGFSQKYLESFARKYNHHYAVLLKEEGYPVAITSKEPIVNVRRVVDNFHHGYIYGFTYGIHIFVTHLSPSSHEKRYEELKTIITQASLLPDTAKILIMGDFNAFSRKDSIMYGKSMLESRKKRDQKYNQTNLNQGKIDFSVTDLILKSGFTDTYWLFNKRFEHTMPTNIDSSRVKRRIDYIWANRNLVPYIDSSGIFNNNKTKNLSDHFPIFVKIKRKGL